MDMTPQNFGLSMLLGFALGGAYMTALWASVVRLGRADHPVRGLILGALLRIILLVAAFLVLLDAGVDRLLGAMVGFLLARFVATRIARRDASSG